MTINDRYRAGCADLAEIDGALAALHAERAHLVGRLDELKALADAGLGDIDIPSPTDDTGPDREYDAGDDRDVAPPVAPTPSPHPA